MKTIEKFLAHLYSLDAKLWIEDANLRCSIPEEVLTDELSVELRSRKSEIINFLRQAKSSTNYTQAITPAARNGNLPLSFAQQRLWFLEQLQPDSYTYNLPTAVRLTGILDVELLERSLNTIIQRHEVLRTNFKTVDGNPVLDIQPSVTLPLTIIDLQAFNPIEQDEEVRHLALEEAQTPFDLATDVLLRVKILQLAKDENVVLFTMHHIISDGWSMEILVKELATLYTAFSANEKAGENGAGSRGEKLSTRDEVSTKKEVQCVTPVPSSPFPLSPASYQPSPLPELAIQYVDFAIWQRQWLQGEVLETQLDYWREQLGGILPVLQLPTDYPRGRVQTFRGAIESFSLSPQLSKGIINLAKNAGVTPFITLLTAYKILLHRYTGQTDILVGTPVANRHRQEIESLIGFFVNTLVLRSNLADNPSFQELLQHLKTTTWQAYDHQDIPFEKLVEVLQPERDLSFNPLFQVKFRLENAPTEKLELPGLTITPVNRTEASAKLDLSLDMYETSEGFVGAFEYNRDLFAPETINRMVGHFQTLLTAIIEHPEKRISELPLLTESEKQTILIDWNQTEVEFPSHLTFQDLFTAQVEKTPDAVAVIFENQFLTYRELNQKSNQLAHYLKQKGAKPEVIVGLCVERSPLMIIALLGILKAGGAYLPLDPNYPPERLGYMLADSQVTILLTETSLKVATSSSYEIIYIDTDWETISQCSTENPESEVKPENLAYLIYTSGSTGKPKGVLIPHIGLTNLTQHKIQVCDVHPGDCVLQFFSLSFDASIPEIIMALGSGAKLCLAKLESLLPGETLLQLLRDNAVTHITITPSALSLLPSADLPHLRMVLVGGEAPSPELIAKWSEGRRFINAYGPTEVTVNASMVLCGNGHPLLPTIRPSANKQLYILDNYLQPVPIGVIGELYIGGIGLARGYLNRPDLTAQRFISNPFNPLTVNSQPFGYSSRTPSENGSSDSTETAKTPTASQSTVNSNSRLYKTGDLACYLPDGRIRLLGRVDNQVKIRGFRIEPQEVETLLCQHPGVRAGVVIVREDKPGEKRLVAYVIPNEEAEVQGRLGEQGNRGEKLNPQCPMPNAPCPMPNPQSLRSFMREKLPEYLVPSAFVLLEDLPLTPNGKVDTHALPAPEQVLANAEFIAPRTEIEAQLADIYAQILKLEKVSIHDDFFELGGHSLIATQLIAQALQVFQVELTVMDLFDAPTVAGLAERILQRQLKAEIPVICDTADDEREEFEI